MLTIKCAGRAKINPPFKLCDFCTYQSHNHPFDDYKDNALLREKRMVYKPIPCVPSGNMRQAITARQRAGRPMKTQHSNSVMQK